MFAAIGGIIGLFTSAMPALIKLFQSRQDNKHELEVMKLQMQREEAQHTARLEEIEAQADITESQALEKRTQVSTTGVKIIDAFLGLVNGLVRPAITYYIAALYGLVKFAEYHVATATMDPAHAVLSIWGEEDMAVLMMVLSYYFGQRAMKYATERWAPR